MQLTDENTKSKKSKKTVEISEQEVDKNINDDEVHEKPKKSKKRDTEPTEEVAEEVHEKPKKSKKRDTEPAEEVANGNEDAGSEKKSKKRKAKSDDEEEEVKEKVPKKKSKMEDESMECENIVEKDEEVEDDPGAFKNFGISDFVAKKLNDAGVKKLFPVQYVSFKDILSGSDVILQSRTGSGKTFSFAIPLVEMLHKGEQERRRFRKPLVLVLTPTRELTKQVADCFTSIANENLSVLCVYGGTPIFQHEKSLRDGVDVLVGTPGRVQDLINRGTLDLSNLKHVVLDEVDRMLDMGFADDVDKILQVRYDADDYKNNPQTLLFSATMPEWARKTSQKYLKPDCKKIDLMKDDDNQTSKTVQHLAIQCSYFDRPATINSVIKVYSGCQGRCIIFCKTKKDADELALSNEMKSEAHVIHGDIPQDKREMVLKGFREGKYRCLIATDVAARGLDIPEVDLVIQCSPPQDVESYIHRSGRTGRAGRQGTCVLFYKKNEEWELRNVENRANIKLKMVGPPSPADIVRASAEDAARALSKVSDEAAKQFEDLAAKMLEEKSAVQCLSAALAFISGNTDLKQRSLISSREGMVTYLFQTNLDLRGMGYVWNALKKFVDEQITETITGMRFCKDRKGCVFDIPVENVDQLEMHWQDGKFDTLKKADTLPELEEQNQRSNWNNDYSQGNNYRNNNYHGNSRGGRGGGGYSRGGRGGFQRRWNK